MQSILGAALKKAKLWKVLGEEGKTFTLFAPTNDALEKIFKEARLTCVHDFYKAQPCTSTADLLSSTNLKTILLNFGKPLRNIFGREPERRYFSCWSITEQRSLCCGASTLPMIPHKNYRAVYY